MELPRMQYQRGFVSLSGLSSQLLALGGWNARSLEYCEKFTITSSKWNALPSLKTPRVWPGSVMLPSKKVFCFYGSC